MEPLYTFNDAFRHLLKGKDKHYWRHDYYLYSFILATNSDKKILRDLISFVFTELNYMTSKYIAIITPNPPIGSDKSENQLMGSDKLINYYLNWKYIKNTQFNYDDRIKSLYDNVHRYENQYVYEVYEFAKYCGVAPVELPCVLFFSSLDNLNEYYIWKIEDIGYTEIISLFRKVTSEVTKLDDSLNELKKRREEAMSPIRNLQEKVSKYSIEIRHLEDKIKRYEKKYDKINDSNQIEEYKNKLDEKAFKYYMENIENLPQEISKLKNQIEDFRSKNVENEKQINNLTNNLTPKIEKIDSEIAKLRKEIDSFDLMEHLDKTRSRKILISKLKESIPLVKLGIDITKAVI